MTRVIESVVSVLVVEDEAVFALDLQQRLQSLGYIVGGIAVTGEEAIKLAGDLNPDLILMDIRLKGKIDGIEAVHQIHTTSDVPVVYITAYADDETIERAKVTMPAGYLAKPIKDRELRSIIEIARYKHRAETAERERRLLSDALQDIASALNSTLELNEVLDRLLESLTLVVSHDAAEVVLVERGDLTVARQRSNLEAECDASEQEALVPILAPQKLKNIVNAGRAVIVNGGNGSDKQDDGQRFETGACAPIQLGGDIIGFLSVFSRESNAYSETHLSHLQAFADQTAVAIRNARYVRELATYSTGLEQLVEVRTAELQKTSRRLAGILDNSPDAVLIVDESDVIEHANQMFYRLFGWEAEEVEGKRINEITPFLDREAVGGALKNMRGKTANQRFEVSVTRKDGSSFDADVALAALRENETVKGIVCTIRDISHLKQIERDLAQARDKAVEATSFRTRLLAIVSHDLRTPIGAIQGYADLLLAVDPGSMTERQIGFAQHIKAISVSASNLVNNLVDQAQLEAGKLILSNDSFIAEELLQSVRTTVEDQVLSKGLEFRTAVAKSVPARLHGDVERLKQIIVNLVSNSIRHTDLGFVSVQFSRVDKAHWAIVVEDTGEGIPAEELEHIFDPFYQGGDPASSRRGKLGLGLAISKQLVNLMEGQIAIESSIGSGTKVVITLPVNTGKNQ